MTETLEPSTAASLFVLDFDIEIKKLGNGAEKPGGGQGLRIAIKDPNIKYQSSAQFSGLILPFQAS